MGTKRDGGHQVRRARRGGRLALNYRAADQLVSELDAAIARQAAARGEQQPAGDSDHHAARVFAAIRPYARRQQRGGGPVDKLMRCHATKREQLGVSESLGPEGKVIYDSVELAQRAADALAAAGLGKVYAYPCGRSRSGHAHLTSSPPSQWSPRLRGLAAAAQREWLDPGREIR